MSSTIIIKNSATSGSKPSTLIQGELAINVFDGKLYYGSGSGNVVKEFNTSSFATSASFALTASYVSSNFQYEVHVSQVDGNDTTGDGSLLKPVATITKALTLTTSQRRLVVVHPGGYTENPTINTTNVTISTSE
jgi:hypothetical protein